MIVYARFVLSIHGLKLETTQQLEDLRLVLGKHAALYSSGLDSDIEVELDEHAGSETKSKRKENHDG